MYRRFFKYYRPYKKLFFLDFFSAVMISILEVMFPIVVNIILRNYLPDETNADRWVLILTAVIALFTFHTISAGFQYIVTYFGHKLGVLIETDLRKELFSHLTKQPFGFYDNKKTGELMSRLTTDLFDIGEFAHHGPEDIFIAVITFITAFVLMFLVHPYLALITVVTVPVIGFFVIYFRRRMVKVNQRIYSRLANFNAGIENAISGIRVVQSFHNEAYENEKFKVINEDYKDAKLGFYKVMGMSHTSNTFLMRILSLTALLASAYFYLKGYIKDYADVVYFILLSNVMIKPIEKMNQVIELYPKGIAGFKRFTEFIDIKPNIEDSKDAYELRDVKGDISYKDVTFRYEETQEPVLYQVSLKIKAGQKIAFVGPSGAGKTTICNLLPRFYEAEKGSITIDGHDIKEVTLKSLRMNIGMVQQDVYLFNGTILENIRYGKLDATIEEVWQVVKLANLEETIKDMPEGLETYIGDRGVKLSGGQKQRIAIARMFLKNPAILILDEATSALDSTTEAMIQSSLELLAKDRTTLIIAHRLATIKSADLIVVVTKEGIEEMGTHEVLLEKQGMYATLYHQQFYQR